MNYILSQFKKLYLKFAPPGVLNTDDVNHWKEKILYTFLFISVFLIFISGATNFPDLIKYKYWAVIWTITIAYVVCLALFFSPAMSFKKRAAIVSLMVYAVGISIIYDVGPFMASREWLFSFSIIASIMLGWPGAISSIILNTLTLVGIGILLKIKFWQDIVAPDNSLFFWFQISTDLFFINVSTTLFVTFLFQKIEKSDSDAKAGANRLIEEQTKLIDANSKLEQEFIERKRAEILLRESEKKYKHLFNHAPAGMYEIDYLTNRFTTINQVMCSYLGYSKKELRSMNPLDLLTHESRTLFKKERKKNIENRKTSTRAEYDIITKQGNKGCVVLNSDFVYEKDTLIGARVVVHDITEIKKIEKEKIEAQKIAGEQKKLALIGQVAGKMAHDFNNILSIIMGNTELSLITSKEADTKRTLNLIFEQTIRGKNLTKNLVAFAKSHEPKHEFFRINDKIDLVISLLKKDLEEIELIKTNKPGVPDLLADPGMIEHALVNLIQNSIHAVGLVKHPKIIVRSYCLNDHICFEIEDNGCGIPQEYLDSIYDPSFTLKGSHDTTSSYKLGIKGTGYGMANVKKYIEQHHGDIVVESTIGSGTTFKITLPVIKRELSCEEKKEISQKINHFKKYILLVEDEPAISNVQYQILTQKPCSHQVDAANNGQAAIDLFNRNTYDLISLDYVLPGKINGMDVYNHVRKTNKLIPILFISGNLEFLESIKQLKQKDDHIDHLSKPCQNKEYVNNMNRLFESVNPTR